MSSNEANQQIPSSSPAPEVVQIGDETFVLDDTAPEGGTEVHPAKVVGEIHDHTASGPYIPDPGAREWKRLTRRPEGRPRQDPPGTVRLCKNERCPNTVTSPSRNPGVLKLFCTPLCGQRYHSRLYARRNRSRAGQWLDRDHNQRQIQLFRVKPATEEVAEARFRAHQEPGHCLNANAATGDVCPAFALRDFYGERKLCLIYAVMADDMKETFAKDRGELYVRQFTTNDGRWLDESEEVIAPHIDKEKGDAPSRMLGGTDAAWDDPEAKFYPRHRGRQGASQ